MGEARLHFSYLPWDDRDKLYQDYNRLQIVYEQALQSLSLCLNERHEVNHSLRYWRILVGPWLGYFIQMVFDRWFMLKTTLTDQEIDGVCIIQRQEGEGVPNDMSDFISLFVEDDWNENIYGQILKFMSIPVKTVCSSSNNIHLQKPKSQSLRTNPQRLKGLVSQLLNKFFGILTRSDDHFFISSYLGYKQDILLQVKLGQIPKLWFSQKLPRFQYSVKERCWKLPLTIDLGNSWCDFYSLLRLLIPQHIPASYLEGYQSLVKISEGLNWPQHPRLIFTSNSYCSDDFFKVWAGIKVEQGTPLIVGQHGGNYGMSLWGFDEEHQIDISDTFLTWGWNDAKQKKVQPLGNLKGFNASKIRPNRTGKALLVEMTMPRYSYHMYSVPVASGQWAEYFQDQCRFVGALPQNIRGSLRIRLYSHDYGLSQVQRWRSLNFSDVELDLGIRPMKELLQQTRLYISTYNATTYLESLSLNFPTIIFWNPKHWELRDGVQPYFDLLKEVGIFHESPESAAKQMTKVWDDIDSWWHDPKTQKAREVFCGYYACIPDKPLDFLAGFFKSYYNKKTVKPY